ncbi:hypothetical protein GCM10028824_11160 [Hymenobacter segetis]
MKQINYSLLLLALLAGSCKKDTTAAKPVARFSAPASIGANVSLQVTNQSTDATDFLWTWGDGTTSTGATPSHAFDTYSKKVRIRLAASSAEGTDTTSQVVEITAGGAPASVMSSAVGNYRGRLYRMNYSGNNFTTVVRDTTMPLTVVSPSRLHLFNGDFDYQLGSYTSPRAWMGHAPERKNASFFSLRNALQLETSGDSIYCYVYSGGVVQAGTIWKFYGKKQP